VIAPILVAANRQTDIFRFVVSRPKAAGAPYGRR
jgi:hypothetical protein